jgi:3-(3-hydroxy-phenyl)propionate hydroxylase
VTAAAGRDLSPALARGPLIRRRSRLRGRGLDLAGTFCPQPWVTADGRRMRLDDVLGDSFAVLTAEPAPPSLRAVADGPGARIVHVAEIGDDGTLAAWLRGGRSDAVLLRPDRVVLDVVPTGGSDFRDAAAWAPLLCTTRRPAVPTDQLAPAPELRSTTR